MAFLKKIKLNGVEYDLSSNLVDKGGIVADTSTGGLKLDLKDDGGLKLDDSGKLAIDSTKFGVKSIASADKTVTVTNTDGAVDLKVNIDSTTIVKDATSGALKVDNEALTEYVGSNAIAVSAANSVKNEKTVSLTINNNDKVLTQDASGLLANLTLDYVTEGEGENQKKYIKLLGKTDNNNAKAELGKVDASDFIKDGMLDSAELVTTAEEGVTNVKAPYIKLTFNTDAGKDVIRFSVKDLVDTYTAGNGISLANNEFSVKLDASNETTYLTLGENGLKLSGVGNIQTEVNAIETAVGLSEAGTYQSPISGVMSGAKNLVEATTKLDEAITANKTMFYVDSNVLYISGVVSEEAKTKYDAAQP